jgi:hypothetical protein
MALTGCLYCSPDIRKMGGVINVPCPDHQAQWEQDYRDAKGTWIESGAPVAELMAQLKEQESAYAADQIRQCIKSINESFGL